MTVGERIKQRRLQLNLTQEELAELAGYKHKSSINKIELDQARLTPDRIQVFCRVLGVTPDFFFYGSEGCETSIMMESLSPINQEKLLSYYNYLLDQQNKEALNES